MPIWKYVFGMVAMARYMGTPLIFIVPDGVMVIGKAPDDGHE